MCNVTCLDNDVWVSSTCVVRGKCCDWVTEFTAIHE